MTTQEIETTQPSTILAISSGQSWFTDKQLAALNHMGVEDAPRGDLAVFLHHCQRTGLDPFAKQIYMIGRKSKGVMKWTIQTGIDGFRVLGDRVAERRSDVIEHDEPLWADADGVWHDVWISAEAPVAAKYTIIKNCRRFVATVMYREFVQTNFDGAPNAMWSKMPCNQLAKCAEVQAWKKVYPNDFAGLVVEDAEQPTDDAPSPRRAERPASRVTTDEILGVRVADALDKARAKVTVIKDGQTLTGPATFSTNPDGSTNLLVESGDPSDIDTEPVDRSDEVAELFATDADADAGE
jgi:phage recombination protein Bet